MRYFLGFLIAIGLIVLIFILILKAFSGSSNSGSAPLPKPLINYANTTTTMQMTIDGQINADQDHQSLQITVGANVTQINIFQGYQGTAVNTKNYANNQAAYAVFLRALDLQNYTKGNPDPSKTDSRGYCPSGIRYTFKIISGDNKTTENYWSTTCGGLGTFQDNFNVVHELFTRQVPNYDQVVQGISLS